ncbi:PREDICTED: uncharacterized protein LOC105460862, partial [Wasmannia auropunctata]|uniref:uncharacterized protein LOC105460862 n=1 Tax=Wasmannia auropunctata TaxID=64793 RepID=UPI0005F06C31
VEAAFILSKITNDDAKFRYVVLNLVNATLPFVSDLIANPPPTEKYQAIKDRIIRSFDETAESKLRKLLCGHEIGDDKPSHFLQRLKNLAGGQCNDSILHLTILASQADKIHEISKPSINALTSAQPSLNITNIIDDLTKRIDALTKEVQRSRRSRSRTARSPRGKFRPKSGGCSQERNLLVSLFGKLAKRPHIQALADVLPKRKVRVTQSCDEFKLFAANGSEIKTYGPKVAQVDLGLRRSFPWKFIVADVTHAILGADFLRHYGLLVDLANKRLIDDTAKLQIPGRVLKSFTLSLTAIDSKCKYYQLFKEYIEITKVSPRKVDIHQIEHHITTRGPPIAERARRLPPEKFKIAKAEFDMMLREGLCQPSSRPWASPLHMVPKKSEGCTVFSKIDLIRAFHQVPLAAEDRPKTAVVALFGLFEFNVMTFKLRNAAQMFQRLIDTALRGLNFCHPYIDDILIASPDHQTHEVHLRAVFDRLRKY